MMHNEDSETVTWTVTIRVPTDLRPRTIQNLEDALLTYVSTMNFVRDATVKRERTAPPK